MGAIDLFSYRDVFPDAPGYQDTDTSKAAAEAMKPRITGIKRKVLDALANRPLAAFELPAATGVSYKSCQPRTTELRLAGLIVDSGERREDPETGKKQIVWRLA